MLVVFRVQYFGDLVFDVIIYFDRGWQRLNPIRDCVWGCGFELGDMENGMYCVKLVGESESERRVSYFSDNVEGTEVLFR